MASDLELVHLAFNRVKELSLKCGDSIPHLISSFQRTWLLKFLAKYPYSQGDQDAEGFL